MLITLLMFALAGPALAQPRPTSLREAATQASLTPPAMPATPPTPAQRNWVARHPVLTGTLIGASVGTTVGLLTCKYPTSEGGSCSDYTYPGAARGAGAVYLGAWGAGIGALAGLVAHAFLH